MTVSVIVIEVVDGMQNVILNGEDFGTGVEFDNQEFFVGEDSILFDDGTPIECESDYLFIAVRNSVEL